MAKNGERKSSKQRNYNFGKNIEEVHTKEILLEDPKECENEPCMYQGRRIPGRGRSEFKVLMQDHVWGSQEPVRKTVWLL